MKVSKIAFLFVCYELCGLLANMSSGFILNRSGYKRTFLGALALHTLASAGYLLVGWMELGVLLMVWVGLLRATRGVAKELLKTTSASYIKKLQTDHLQSHWLLGGKDSAKGVGLLMGGILLTLLGFTGAFVILTVSTLLCFFWAAQNIDDVREEKHISFQQFTQVESRMKWLAGGRAFLYAGRDMWLVLALPIYLSSLGISKVNVGAILAVGLVTFGLIQPLSGWWVKQRWTWREYTLKQPWLYERVLPFSCTMLALVPVLMLMYGQNLAAAIVLIVLYNIFSGVATAPHNDLQMRFAQQERASVDIAYYKTIAQLGKISSVFASGVIYQYWGLQGCLWASMGCLLLSGIIGLWVSTLSKRTPQAKKFIAKYVDSFSPQRAPVRTRK
jgi:predicted MFS family arabinose efflux permease